MLRAMSLEARQAANAIDAWARVMRLPSLDDAARATALAVIERNARVLIDDLRPLHAP